MKGALLLNYHVAHGDTDQWSVTFDFETGRRVMILHRHDRTDYVIV
ncbi:MAG: hypothetical protein AAGI52_02825 [Bacteroidota bacterium]